MPSVEAKDELSMEESKPLHVPDPGSWMRKGNIEGGQEKSKQTRSRASPILCSLSSGNDTSCMRARSEEAERPDRSNQSQPSSFSLHPKGRRGHSTDTHVSVKLQSSIDEPLGDEPVQIMRVLSAESPARENRWSYNRKVGNRLNLIGD